MNIRYESMQDVLIVTLRSHAPIAAVREHVGGTICRYDGEGALVSLEIADASRNIDQIRFLERRLNEFVDGRASRGRDEGV